MDVYIGWPGKVHGARAFANSELFKRINQGTLTQLHLASQVER